MQRFWRTLGVLAVLSAVYVGHGLHSMDSDPLTAPARADITELPSASMERFVTSGQDGKIVYVWEWVGNTPHCVSKVSAESWHTELNHEDGRQVVPPHFYHLAD